MWEQYGQKDKGIAIRSTFARLRESMSTPYLIHIGMVNYIDYAKDIIPQGNAFHALFCKRRSFEHEHELRAIFIKPSETNDSPRGLDIPCELNKLIDKIFVSPESPNWYRQLVNSVLQKYDLDREARRSKLDEDPFY